MDTTENKLYPCLNGNELLKLDGVREKVQRIRALCGAPERYWQSLYWPMMQRAAECLQQIPSTLDSEQLALEKMLEDGIRVLRLRQGLILPKNSNAEMIAQEKELWTFALFSSVLLLRSAQMIKSYSIELQLNNGQILSTWHPWSGCLYEEGLYYSFKTQNMDDGSTLFGSLELLWINRLLPAVAMRFLSDFPNIQRHWWAVVTKSSNDDNPINEILKKALGKLSASDDSLIVDKTPTISDWIDWLNDLMQVDASESIEQGWYVLQEEIAIDWDVNIEKFSQHWLSLYSNSHVDKTPLLEDIKQLSQYIIPSERDGDFHRYYHGDWKIRTKVAAIKLRNDTFSLPDKTTSQCLKPEVELA